MTFSTNGKLREVGRANAIDSTTDPKNAEEIIAKNCVGEMRNSKGKLTDADRRMIIECWKHNISVSVLVEMFNVGKSTIYSVIKSHLDNTKCNEEK